MLAAAWAQLWRDCSAVTSPLRAASTGPSTGFAPPITTTVGCLASARKRGVNRSAGRRNFPFHECVYSCGSSSRAPGPLAQSHEIGGSYTVSLLWLVFEPNAAHAFT